MRYFCFALVFVLCASQRIAFGSEEGMPQLNPEFWAAQIFWLFLIFSILYFVIWKVFLPKITDNIESRKLRVINDLNETEKLKENAEKKLKEYNEIIEASKIEAKKIIEENKKKLDKEIENKKQKFNDEIEKELLTAEKEIKDLKKSSVSSISKIASEISEEIIKQLVMTEINKSNVSAIVEDITKRKTKELI